MSLNSKGKLRRVAMITCRELRGSPTKAEKVLWQQLRRRGMQGFKFLRQYPVFHDITGMESFFVADFYCHRARLVVEVDGEIHIDQKEEDEHRTKIINMLGLRVIRFTNQEVLTDLENVLALIGLKCTETQHSSFPFSRERRTGG